MGVVLLVLLVGCQAQPTPTPTVEIVRVTPGIPTTTPNPAPIVTNTPSNPTLLANVIPTGDGLRVRREPSETGTVLQRLSANQSIVLIGRTPNNLWVQMQSTFPSAWVSITYLAPQGDLNSLPITSDTIEIVESNTAIRGSQAIVDRGRSLGNAPNVFAKVGDSITDTRQFLRQIVNGYDLYVYQDLQAVIQYFSAPLPIVGGNSFSTISRAAKVGWASRHVLDPTKSDPNMCQAGETPLACEYRLTRPSVSLIMLGTNDPPNTPTDYERNLRQIIQISVDNGVVPVLSTLPPRYKDPDAIFQMNQIIVRLTQEYGIPLWDLYSALVPLPNQGLAGDGIHLSLPPGGAAGTVDFSPDNLQYGATMRNFTALQILNEVWQNILS